MTSSEDGFVILNRWKEENSPLDFLEVFDVPSQPAAFTGVAKQVRVFLVFPEQGIVIFSADGSDTKIAKEWRDAQFSVSLERGESKLAKLSFGSTLFTWSCFLDIALPDGKRFCLAERVEEDTSG